MSGNWTHARQHDQQTFIILSSIFKMTLCPLSPSSAIDSSVLCHPSLSSVVCHLSSSSVFCHLSSVIRYPSSAICHLLSVVRRPSSALCPRRLPSVVCPLSSAQTGIAAASASNRASPACGSATAAATCHFDHWMQLDMEYIDNWSLLLDFKILAQTIPAVLKGSGAA